MSTTDKLKKRKRKELKGADEATDDADDAEVLAARWAASLKAGTCAGGGASVAVWLPRHRVAVVTTLRGKMVGGTFGEAGLGATLCLLPEEALYLAESGHLMLYHGGADTVVRSFAEAAGLGTGNAATAGGVDRDSVASPPQLGAEIARIAGDTAASDVALDRVDSSGETAALTQPAAPLWPLATTEHLYGALVGPIAGLPLACYTAYRALRERKEVARRPVRLLTASCAAASGPAANGQSTAAVERRRVNPAAPPADVPFFSPGTALGLDAVAFETFPWCVNGRAT